MHVAAYSHHTGLVYKISVFCILPCIGQGGTLPEGEVLRSVFAAARDKNQLTIKRSHRALFYA